MPLEFEWDETKNQANVLKHGIGFEDAVRIFEGPIVTREDRRFEYGEVRQISTGSVDGLLVVTVVHTDRLGRTRVISARRASQRERKLYEASI